MNSKVNLLVTINSSLYSGVYKINGYMIHYIKLELRRFLIVSNYLVVLLKLVINSALNNIKLKNFAHLNTISVMLSDSQSLIVKINFVF